MEDGHLDVSYDPIDFQYFTHSNNKNWANAIYSSDCILHLSFWWFFLPFFPELIYSEAEKQQLLRTLNNFKTGSTEVKTLRMLLHGPVGAGKSSFFNSMDNVLQGRNTTRALADSLSGRSFTMEVKAFHRKVSLGHRMLFIATALGLFAGYISKPIGVTSKYFWKKLIEHWLFQ